LLPHCFLTKSTKIQCLSMILHSFRS
jgi:hypothetical protein